MSAFVYSKEPHWKRLKYPKLSRTETGEHQCGCSAEGCAELSHQVAERQVIRHLGHRRSREDSKGAGVGVEIEHHEVPAGRSPDPDH